MKKSRFHFAGDSSGLREKKTKGDSKRDGSNQTKLRKEKQKHQEEEPKEIKRTTRTHERDKRKNLKRKNTGRLKKKEIQTQEILKMV